MNASNWLDGKNRIVAELDHTGTYRWRSNVIKETQVFRAAYTQDTDGRRVRRFVTYFSLN